jgi:cytochrome P450
MLEDTKISGIVVKKGDPFIIDMHHLHRNPKEWR